MTELETLQAELDAINQQIQAIRNPIIAAEKAAMTEDQKLHQIRGAITTANRVLSFFSK
jgi:outer membrane murein-binding lipoprotein Lpp